VCELDEHLPELSSYIHIFNVNYIALVLEMYPHLGEAYGLLGVLHCSVVGCFSDTVGELLHPSWFREISHTQ
jgi:cytochrome b subunit of formate dehydrogenase